MERASRAARRRGGRLAAAVSLLAVLGASRAAAAVVAAEAGAAGAAALGLAALAVPTASWCPGLNPIPAVGGLLAAPAPPGTASAPLAAAASPIGPNAVAAVPARLAAAADLAPAASAAVSASADSSPEASPDRRSAPRSQIEIDWLDGPRDRAKALAKLRRIVRAAGRLGLSDGSRLDVDDAWVEAVLASPSRPPLRKLEVGPGRTPICKDCDYLDTDPGALRALRRKGLGSGLYVRASAEVLPYADGSVSKIVSAYFPWLGTTRAYRKLKAKILAEYRRVLPPGGIVALVNYDETSGAPRRGENFQAHLYYPLPGSPDDYRAIRLSGLADGDDFRVDNHQLVAEARKAGFSVQWFQSPKHRGLLLIKTSR
jgi:hypothetical protein